MKLKDNKGVTGVDVAIATVTFMVFVTLIGGLFYNLSSTSKKIERKTVATNLAIDVIEALKVTDFADLDSNIVSEAEMREEQLEALTGKNIDIPNGYKVKITIKNPEKDGAEDTTLGSVVKIIISDVSYQNGKGEIETVRIETLVKNIT